MITDAPIPRSIKDAKSQLKHSLRFTIEQLSPTEFARAWSAVCFLNPGLHPDGYDEEDNSWPEELQKFAADAWRRFETGEIGDAVLYPSDATHAGLVALMTKSSAV